jgi:hypothetical protein
VQQGTAKPPVDKPAEAPKTTVDKPSDAAKPTTDKPAEAAKSDVAEQQKVAEEPSSEAQMLQTAKAKRTADLQQKRAENGKKIDELKSQRDLHEERRAKYQEQAEQRRAKRKIIEDDKSVETKQRQASNEAKLRDEKQSEISRLETENRQLKEQIDKLNEPPAITPQQGGLRFEGENVEHTAMPKNKEPHDTRFGSRIPDHMPRLPKQNEKGVWVTAETPGEAEFIADSKLLGRKITLTDQLRGFIELAGKTKQKVLLLLTDPGAEIADTVHAFASKYGVRVRSMTRPVGP